MTGVERWWFRINFAQEEVPLLYYSDDDPAQDFDSLEGDATEAFAVWNTECERARAIVAATPTLDTTGGPNRSGAGACSR